MLWFLLTAVAYATALAGVVGAVGFVAVQRYALLQRLLAAGVDRVLARLVEPEGGHSVTHTDAGGRPPRRRQRCSGPSACPPPCSCFAWLSLLRSAPAHCCLQVQAVCADCSITLHVPRLPGPPLLANSSRAPFPLPLRLAAPLQACWSPTCTSVRMCCSRQSTLAAEPQQRRCPE